MSATICLTTALFAAAVATPAAIGAAQSAPPSVAVTDTVLRFTAADGTPLVGKLTRPAGAGPNTPVVFHLHGAGPRDYDHMVRYRAADGQIRATSYYGFYGQEFARRGVAFFRISKRGCSVDSTGRPVIDRAVFSKATPSVLIDDYLAGLEALRCSGLVDTSRVALYGTSEGTRLAPQLVTRSPAGVVGLVLASYQSDNFRNTVVWQNSIGPWRNLQHLIPAASDGELTRAEHEEAVAKNAAIGQRLPFGPVDLDSNGVVTPAEMAKLVKPRLDAIVNAVTTRNDDLLWQAVLNLTSAYLLEGWEGEPTHALLLPLRVPIGIFHGDLDGATRVEGVRETEAAFRSAGRTNLTVRIYPGFDHDLGWTPATAASGGTRPHQDSFNFAADLLRRR